MFNIHLHVKFTFNDKKMFKWLYIAWPQGLETKMLWHRDEGLFWQTFPTGSPGRSRAPYTQSHDDDFTVPAFPVLNRTVPANKNESWFSIVSRCEKTSSLITG